MDNTYDNIVNRLSQTTERINNKKTVVEEKKGEEPAKCYIPDEIDDYSTKIIQTGEVCTIETAKEYGIFGKNTYFNSLIPIDEKPKIDIHIDNMDIDSDYSLCSVKNDNAYENCVLNTKNPWKSLNPSNEFCMLPIDIKLPSVLKYNDTKKTIDKPLKIPIFKSDIDFCQERWYDWFAVPDFHFGNGYIPIEDKCYKPCEIGKLPTKDMDGSIYDRCIIKDKYEFGFYSSTFNYLPIALIVLLGSTKDTLLKYYHYYANVYKDRLKELTPDAELYKSLHFDENTKKNVYEDIKIDLQNYINNLFEIPFNIDNIIPPDLIIQNLSNHLMTKDRIQHAYDIASTFYELSTGIDIETVKKYSEWKQKICDINGYDLNSSKLIKQLLVLKKACNVAFDNTTQYSKDIILYTLNKSLEEGEPYKNPIKFKLSSADIDMSINTTDIAVKQNDIVKTEEEKKIEDDKKKSALETMCKLLNGGFNADYNVCLKKIEEIKQNNGLSDIEKKEKITETINQYYIDKNKLTDPSKISDKDKEDLRIFFELVLDPSEFERIMNMLNENDKNTIRIYYESSREQISGKIQLNSIDNPDIYDKDEETVNFVSTKDKNFDTSKTIVLTVFFIILIIIIAIVFIAVLSLLWSPFTWICNQIILGFLFIVYFIKNMFKGKYSPSHLDIDLTDLQMYFIDNKIMFDQRWWVR